MLGGRSTVEAAGISVPHRDEIYARISAIPEGTLFRAETILGDDNHLSTDFTLLRDHDYLHITDGWMVGVVETQHLRRSPYLAKMLSSYEDIMGCTLVPTGDRMAWESDLREWEPLQGYRYYTDGETRLITMGTLKVRVLNAPAWLRDTSTAGRLLRILYDTPEKELADLASRANLFRKISREDFDAVVDMATSISNSTDFEDPSCEYRDPLLVVQAIQPLLLFKDEKQ